MLSFQYINFTAIVLIKTKLNSKIVRAERTIFKVVLISTFFLLFDFRFLQLTAWASVCSIELDFVPLVTIKIALKCYYIGLYIMYDITCSDLVRGAACWRVDDFDSKYFYMNRFCNSVLK